MFGYSLAGPKHLSSPPTAKGSFPIRLQHRAFSLYHVFNKQSVPNQAKSIKGSGIMRLKAEKAKRIKYINRHVLDFTSPLSLRKTRAILQHQAG